MTGVGGFDFESAGGPFEPSAADRRSCRVQWEVFAGFVAAGFTSDQAMYLLGQIVHAQVLGVALATGLRGDTGS